MTEDRAALVARAETVAVGLDRAGGCYQGLAGEYPELTQLGLGELFLMTATLLRDLLADHARLREELDGLQTSLDKHADVVFWTPASVLELIDKQRKQLETERARADRLEQELTELRAYRDRNIVLGLEIGQILGAEYDGMDLRKVARRVIAAEARLSALLSGGWVQHKPTCHILAGLPVEWSSDPNDRTWRNDVPCSCGLDAVQKGER